VIVAVVSRISGETPRDYVSEHESLGVVGLLGGSTCG